MSTYQFQPFALKLPATSSNLGSAFDAVGIALALYNIVEVLELLPKGEFIISVKGEGIDNLTDAQNNKIISSYLAACQHMGLQPHGLRLSCINNIPRFRGLGSSSSAIVAGVMIANHMSPNPMSKEDLLPLMTQLEGHPDNVAPCCLGGFVVSVVNEKLHHIKIEQASAPAVVVGIPDVKFSSYDARAILPKEVPFEDVAFNISRAALLTAAWSSGRWDLLPIAMEDNLHQQHRLRLFKGGVEIFQQIKEDPKVLSASLSGSGPSILAFTKPSNASYVGEKIKDLFTSFAIMSEFMILPLDNTGAKIASL